MKMNEKKADYMFLISACVVIIGLMLLMNSTTVLLFSISIFLLIVFIPLLLYFACFAGIITGGSE